MANHANKKSPTVVKSNARILTAKKISQHRLAYGNKDDKGGLIAVLAIKRSGITKLKRVPFSYCTSQYSGDFRDDSPHASRSLTLIRYRRFAGERAFINAIKTLGQAREYAPVQCPVRYLQR